jgi:enoyl-CoA hydratase/carnithine racemase
VTNLLVDDVEGVRVLTFNRPDKLNAFDTALYQACGLALDEAAADETVGCVVLTGAGRAFSAGQDLAEMAEIAKSPGTTDAASGFPRFIDTAAVFEKPLLAAVNGLGVGVGLTVLLHCDVAFIAESARLRAPFVPLGVVPEAAGSLLMPTIMGNQRAAAALYTGDWISAAEAVASGLALAAVPDAEVLPRTLELATRIAAQPLGALMGTKRVVIAGRIDAIRAARAREDAAFAAMMGAGSENAAALGAFLDGGITP